MTTKEETPEQERERLHQEEQKKNPAGNFNDHLTLTLADMPNTTGMSVKEIGVLILIVLLIFIVYIIYKLF
ncbi:DUF6366 family protein [Calidifontibacillus erzurumensis]|uniref:Uncharacterized protein n=1 Tax=Calidifontibacillus erzurumensis TaxID=2741433 RepID=A0A8J8GDB3_9BACI|nr:DUF6366 family protein [Calidifontibacillus erzurumensis]NSL51572.1 hypothetical protein [Calidifontibacillus erzurumensis]